MERNEEPVSDYLSGEDQALAAAQFSSSLALPPSAPASSSSSPPNKGIPLQSTAIPEATADYITFPDPHKTLGLCKSWLAS